MRTKSESRQVGKSVSGAARAIVLALLLTDLPTYRLHAQDRTTVTVAGQQLEVPRGFTVESYVDSLPGARFMAQGPDGAVYVSQPRAGRVVKITAPNAVAVVASGLSRPHGLAFRGDTLYVAETNRIVRFVPGSSEPQVLVPVIPSGQGHWTRTIVFGADGKMYVSIGSSCNICDQTDERRAAVVRYNPDGSGEEIFARGLRNSVGLAFHPTTRELWATNNDRDMLGDDVPPERINILREGRFYGWPQCNLPGTRNPEYPAADCSAVEPPALTFQAHSAPLGIAFYTGSRFPRDWQGDAIMAQHGSWNRSVKVGYQVMRVRVQNGRPTALEPFVTGFLPAGATDPWERPVDVLVLRDGSVLISGDRPGRILRVTYTGR